MAPIIPKPMDVVKQIEQPEIVAQAPDAPATAGHGTEPVDTAPATSEKRAGRSWPAWLRVALFLALVAVLAVPLVLFRETLFKVFEEREQVVAEVRAAGAWGPLVIIGLAIGQTIVAPIPGQVVNFVSGYIYGLWPGMLYSWLGLVLGTAIAMAMARFAGRPLVERIIGKQMLERVDRAAAGRGLSFFFLFFLIPGLPDDVLCFVAGFTALPLRALVLISAVARVPGLIGSAWLGSQAHSLPVAVWVLLAILGLVATYIAWRYGEQLQERVLGWLKAS